MNKPASSNFLSNKKSNALTYTLGFEVLDNLPHDKIIRCKDTGSILQAEVFPVEKTMNSNEDTQFKEKYQTLTDPLLKKIMLLLPSHYCTNIRWVPTVAYGILYQLFLHRPNSRLIIADFDYLPPPDLTDISPSSTLAFHAGGPLITSMEKIDYGCYLSAPPFCDILFPTDFQALAYYTKKLLHYNDIANREVESNKQADFFLKFGSDEVDKTRNIFGYSPLINDFSNCSVLTVLGK